MSSCLPRSCLFLVSVSYFPIQQFWPCTSCGPTKGTRNRSVWFAWAYDYIHLSSLQVSRIVTIRIDAPHPLILGMLIPSSLGCPRGMGPGLKVDETFIAISQSSVMLGLREAKCDWSAHQTSWAGLKGISFSRKCFDFSFSSPILSSEISSFSRRFELWKAKSLI